MFKMNKLISAILGSTLLVASSASKAENIAEIYELALKNDPSFLAAEANLKIGELQEMSGLSGLLPQVTGNGSYGLGGKSHLSRNNDTTTLDQHSGGQSYNISLNQTLFDMSSWFRFRTGELKSEQAQAQFSADQQDLIIRVTDAYLFVLRANDTLDTSLAQEKALNVN